MMKYTTISDSHVHSCFSHDGNDPVMMLCDYAMKMGLYALTITYHTFFVDKNEKKQSLFS